jgi:menaquinone reductase, molybdopterin-binding-like subunit
LGVLFSPLPWKLLDDSAIWTQNWSKIPKLGHGPLTTRYTSCTLCPSGCAVRARCSSGTPNLLSGAPTDPRTHGALCAAGLLAHHLAFHQFRFTAPSAFRGRGPDATLEQVTLDDAMARIVSRLRARQADELFAILDHQPGRAVSVAYQDLCASLPRGTLLTPSARENDTQEVLRTMTASDHESFALDLEHTRTLLSFGAPLFDEWGDPGRIAALRAKGNGGTIIHVDHSRSRTAQNADQWLPVRPGTEILLALGIGNILINENLVPHATARAANDYAEYRALVATFTPEYVGRATGINPEEIRKLAHTLVASSPTAVIAGCDPAAGPMGRAAGTAIAGLNLLLGSVGRDGGFVRHKEPWSVAHPQTLDRVPDHSIAVLFVDPSRSGYGTSTALITRKLVKNDPLVVSFTSLPSQFEGIADLIIPAPAPFESLEEAGAESSTFSLSAPLHPSRKETLSPLEVMGRIVAQAGGTGPATSEELLKARCQAIFTSHRGSATAWQSGATTPVSTMTGGEDLWKLLGEGGMWSDDPQRQNGPAHYSLLAGMTRGDLQAAANRAAQATEGPVMIPDGTRHAVAGSYVSPLMTKLYQESDLRVRSRHVRLNPITGTQNNLDNNSKAILQTEHGALEVTVRFDATVLPGVLLVAAGPTETGERPETAVGDVLSLSTIQEDGTWRLTPASIRRA